MDKKKAKPWFIIKLNLCDFSSGHTTHKEVYLKGKLVFLLIGERNVLWHHLSQVVLHKIHCEAEPLFDLISGGSIIVVAGLLDENHI